jgi:hypothetical protein
MRILDVGCGNNKTEGAIGVDICYNKKRGLAPFFCYTVR